MSDQYGRKIGLIVSAGDSGLDLSKFRIKFSVQQSDVSTPNNAVIKIYNLSEQTAQRVQKEFTRVTLQAGYETGNYGIVFDGTIKMVRRGRDNPTDTYVEMVAADGDVAHNFAVVNKTLAAGSTAKQRLDAVAAAMNLPVGYAPDLPPGALSRGKVLFGMARGQMDTLASTTKSTWSIQNGRVQVIPLTSYKPGEAVVINSTTGMVGLPVQTEQGIEAACLLNPKITIGCLLQINNKDVQGTLLGGSNLYAPGRLEQIPGLLPRLTDDGFYRVYVAEHVGDSWGGPDSEWFTRMTCLAIDRSAAVDNSVRAYG